MTRLSDLSHGTTNRFTLIRLIAALAVLVSHAWPLTLGAGAAEPLQALTGKTLGTWAVMVFFALSGFLIAGSWERAPNARRFLALRAARLLPALWAMLVVVALGLGPLVSSLPVWNYLGESALWQHLGVNGALFALDPDLPGVFQENPYPKVQGSIWTLGYEALCYLGILTLGLAGLLSHPLRGACALAVAAVAGSALLALPGDVVPGRMVQLANLGLPFAAGAALWVLRAVVPMSLMWATGLATLAYLGQGTPAEPVLQALAIAYITLYLGLAPGPDQAHAARLPDYSYGLYLYAFPIQGLVVHLAAPEVGPQDLALHIGLSATLALACAALSWHAIEQPCLDRVRIWLRGGHRQGPHTKASVKTA